MPPALRRLSLNRRCMILVHGLAVVAGVAWHAGTGRSAAGEPPRAGFDAAGAILAVLSRGQPMLANVTDEYQVVRLWPNSDAFLEARGALDQSCEGFEFHEVGLREAVAAIARKAGTDIAFDHEPLAAMGLDLEVPVTLRGGSMPLKSLLRSILDDLDLTVVFRHDRLVVTTHEAAAADLEKVFYPLIPGVDPDGVVALIEQVVAPTSWDSVGGSGTIATAPAGLGNGLIVSQTGPVHDQVEGILRGLDAAHWQAESVDEGVVPRFVRIYAVDDEEVLAELAAKLVDLVNDCLPHGIDANAEAAAIGGSLVVKSASRPFHVMAAQVVTAITGTIQDLEVEADFSDGTAAENAAGDDSRT